MKKKGLIVVQFTLFVVFFSLITGCGGGFEYLNKAENPYNYPQQDYFVDKGYNRVSDFDLQGNVKSVVQYKALKNPLSTNKSLDFELSFTPQGYFNTKSTYHTGSFFFHGKKDIETKAVFKKREKQLIDKHVMADSVIVKLVNTYDKLGNLTSTEDEFSLKRYYYDSKERLIKEEQYQKTNAGVSNSPVAAHTIEFKNDNYKVKTRLREAGQEENLMFQNTYREFFYYDDHGNLEKRQTAVSNDTITFHYNKNRQLNAETYTRAGKPFRAVSYQYDEQTRLIEDRHYRQGTLYQTNTYVYNDKNHLIKRTSYLNSQKISETIHDYTYDTNNNWIAKSTVLTDMLGDEVYELGTITREIEYYEFD